MVPPVLTAEAAEGARHGSPRHRVRASPGPRAPAAPGPAACRAQHHAAVALRRHQLLALELDLRDQRDLVAQRDAFCPVAGRFIAHTVYERADLGAGFACDGPVIVQEDESTTIIGSDGRLTVDSQGSLLIEIKEDAA